MQERVYLTHFKRGEDICPQCEAALVWRKVGDRKYCPCDRNPVLCMWDPCSPLHVVYKGEIITGVKILTAQNAGDFIGQRTFYALQPHVFTCKKFRYLSLKYARQNQL
ncbi:MAG: hypothetical protein LKK39_06635 [Oscillospiraceae bacterium]|jgi:hypothetical protein|nr:hypothetical protein [Oscillospiraceae bacterium]MCI2190695.1 hypothetical protein [Oscillospiraceae bacterium]MCI2205390.1 hypothetical protein [Oscillospiraceae bacterium]